MGASTLAFVPVRDAALTEGGSEVVLLPRLVREALDVRSVGFQVAPAGSEAPASHIAGLDLQAPRGVWIVDGDEGGADIRRRGVRGTFRRRVFHVERGELGAVLEDFLAPGLYARALNAGIRSKRDRRCGAGVTTARRQPSGQGSRLV